MKKSYNPLKMLGTYLGLMLGIGFYSEGAIVQGVFCPKLNFVALQSGQLICSSEGNMFTFFLGMQVSLLTYYIIWIIIFILLGWGVHSILRFNWRFKI